MSETARGAAHTAKKLAALGLGMSAVAAAFMNFGTATANAEVIEIAPRPNVSSRQAVVIDQNALRRTGIGNTRGALGDHRRAGRGGVNAQGDIRDSVIAVPGTSSAPFLLPQNGQFRSGAPIGSW